jgi:Zn-dependent protease with chaperone function
VIAVTAIYFYVSMPVLILLVIGVALGALYLLFSIGHIPITLVLTICAAVLFTLYAVVRSVFTRVKQQDPGRFLSRAEAPRLWSLAEEVAGDLGIRPVDAIYVTPSAQIAVTERGGIWAKLRGLGRRYLILGLGSLPGMTMGQLRAILAHEYGHFGNRDTAGGNLARQVWISMNQMVLRLAASGQARSYNPAWLFTYWFRHIFARITLGASRLQEILADRYGAVAYGSANSISGLKHVIRQGLVFKTQVNREVQAALGEGRELRNIYSLPALDCGEELDEIEAREAETLERPTSPYDSHPSPRDRIALLEQLEGTEEAETTADPAWDLLAHPEKLQTEMTDLVRANIERLQA